MTSKSANTNGGTWFRSSTLETRRRKRTAAKSILTVLVAVMLINSLTGLAAAATSYSRGYDTDIGSHDNRNDAHVYVKYKGGFNWHYVLWAEADLSNNDYGAGKGKIKEKVTIKLYAEVYYSGDAPTPMGFQWRHIETTRKIVTSPDRSRNYDPGNLPDPGVGYAYTGDFKIVRWGCVYGGSNYDWDKICSKHRTDRFHVF